MWKQTDLCSPLSTTFSYSERRSEFSRSVALYFSSFRYSPHFLSLSLSRSLLFCSQSAGFGQTSLSNYLPRSQQQLSSFSSVLRHFYSFSPSPSPMHLSKVETNWQTAHKYLPAIPPSVDLPDSPSDSSVRCSIRYTHISLSQTKGHNPHQLSSSNARVTTPGLLAMLIYIRRHNTARKYIRATCTCIYGSVR